MGKLQESISQVKELLKGVVTADNTEAIAQVSKALDEVTTQGDTLEKENISLKDKIVDMVKGNLSTTTPPKDESSSEAPKSLDDIMKEEADKIIANRRK